MVINEYKIDKVVEKIINDLKSRNGLSDIWDSFDKMIKSEIIQTWKKIIRKEIIK